MFDLFALKKTEISQQNYVTHVPSIFKPTIIYFNFVQSDYLDRSVCQVISSCHAIFPGCVKLALIRVTLFTDSAKQPP